MLHHTLITVGPNFPSGLGKDRFGTMSLSLTYIMFQIFLIVMSLLADAVIGNVQEKTMKQYGATQVEVILYSYSIGTVYLFIGEIVSNSFVPATRNILDKKTSSNKSTLS